MNSNNYAQELKLFVDSLNSHERTILNHIIEEAIKERMSK